MNNASRRVFHHLCSLMENYPSKGRGGGVGMVYDAGKGDERGLGRMGIIWLMGECGVFIKIMDKLHLLSLSRLYMNARIKYENMKLF